MRIANRIPVLWPRIAAVLSAALLLGTLYVSGTSARAGAGDSSLGEGLGLVHGPLPPGRHTFTLSVYSDEFAFGYFDTWNITVSK